MQLANGLVGRFQEHLIQADYSHTTEDFFQALFINDCIQLNMQFPCEVNSPDSLGDPQPFRSWADGLPIGMLLGQLIVACERLDFPRAMACTDSYLERAPDRRPLMRALALAASKLQNDPHQQRNAASNIEEWELTTATAYRDTLLRAWTKYGAGGTKRTTIQDCTRLFEQELGVAPTQSVVSTPVRSQQDLGVMGLTLTKPVGVDAGD